MQQGLFSFDSLAAEIKAAPTKGIVPRDYQREAIDNAFRLWDGGSIGAIARSPTGSGKTVIGSLTARQWLDQGPEYRVMILAHEKQLVWQFTDEVQDILGIAPGVEMASLYVQAGSVPQITVASRDSLKIRKELAADGNERQITRLQKFDPHEYKWLLILDECHRWVYKNVSCRYVLDWFRQSPHTKVLGLTATPQRGDNTSLKKVVPDVALDYRLYDLDGGRCAVRDGWAVRYDQRFVVVQGVDFKAIKEVAHDFDEEELEKELTTTKALASMIVPTLDLVGQRRTILFSVTVKMAKAVAAYINAVRAERLAAGEDEAAVPGEAVELDGSAPPHIRRDVYRAHQNGEFQFLSVCSLCREGYNDPGIAAVAIYRPTKSKGLAEQMKGRGCRPLRGCVTSTMSREERVAAIAASAKPDCMVIDLVGVTGMADCASTAQIIAEGKEDVVIERANRNMLAKKPGESLDAEEEVRKAQREIDEEREQAKEAARLRREEERRREDFIARRREAMKASVTYTSRPVVQGHGAKQRVSPFSHKAAMMQYGKYRGKKLSEVPSAYLQRITTWDQARWQWKRQAQDELKRRAGTAPRAGDNGQRPKTYASADDINRLLQESWQ